MYVQYAYSKIRMQQTTQSYLLAHPVRQSVSYLMRSVGRMLISFLRPCTHRWINH